jgi:hypothetical protein
MTLLPAILAGATWVLIMYAFGTFPMFCAINTYKMTGVALTDYFTGSRHTRKHVFGTGAGLFCLGMIRALTVSPSAFGMWMMGLGLFACLVTYKKEFQIAGAPDLSGLTPSQSWMVVCAQTILPYSCLWYAIGACNALVAWNAMMLHTSVFWTIQRPDWHDVLARKRSVFNAASFMFICGMITNIACVTSMFLRFLGWRIICDDLMLTDVQGCIVASTITVVSAYACVRTYVHDRR